MRSLRSAAVLACAVGASACLEHANPYDPDTSLQLTLHVDEQVQVTNGRLFKTARLTWLPASDVGPVWRVLPDWRGSVDGGDVEQAGEDVASVALNGTGGFTVEARFGDRVARGDVTVTASPYWITVDPCTDLTMTMHERIFLRAVVRNAAGDVVLDTNCESEPNAVDWFVVNQNVAWVWDGEIEPRGIGETIIEVRYPNAPYRVYVPIRVEE